MHKETHEMTLDEIGLSEFIDPVLRAADFRLQTMDVGAAFIEVSDLTDEQIYAATQGECVSSGMVEELLNAIDDRDGDTTNRIRREYERLEYMEYDPASGRATFTLPAWQTVEDWRELPDGSMERTFCGMLHEYRKSNAEGLSSALDHMSRGWRRSKVDTLKQLVEKNLTLAEPGA